MRIERINNLKNELETFFNNKSFRLKKYKFKVLRKKFCFEKGYKVDELREALAELELEGKIYYNGVKELYSAFPRELGYLQGEININKFGEGYINTEDGIKCRISVDELNDALDGDIVVIKTTPKNHDKSYKGRVDKIVKRKDGLVICEVEDNYGSLSLKPYNVFLKHSIIINDYAMRPLVAGDRILVKIDELTNKKVYYAGVIKSLGHKDDANAELQVIAAQNSITIDFNPQALLEADEIPTSVSEEEIKGRLDYREKLIFSIDGADTKDRDDAISVELDEFGNYLVGVHISDVSHYIHPGMALWDEGKTREFSVYMAGTCIPLFPHKLSNGICSLNPNVDRLTLSCMMKISPDGKVLSYDFVDAVINSRKAMTYDDVNKILEDGEVPEGYEEFVDTLILANNLSMELEKQKIKRGYVDFGTNDIEITLDDDDNPIAFKQRTQRKAQKLIENLMLIAGESAAHFLAIPSPYRVHEKPDQDHVSQAFESLSKTGIRVTACREILNGKFIQNILNQIKDIDERKVAAQIILRAMPRAKYSIDNVGHFGLGLYEYCQFTSPIRRFPDLVIHENIRLQRDNKFSYGLIDAYEEDIKYVAQQATYKELKADEAEREANQFEMIKYMKNHIGEKFMATVTYVNSQGIFIKTEEGIDGKIDINDIEGDYFVFDNRTLSFKGRKTKVKIKIGSKLCLVAVDTNKEYKTINFGMEEEDILALKKA